MLEGPALHYYEQRGGALLGSIPVVGAKIGKQQQDRSTDAEDEKAYRHAFLLIEPGSGPNSSATRHVLCAESDSERDSWVSALMRHVIGQFDEPGRMSTSSSAREELSSVANTPTQTQPNPPRASTSSSVQDLRGVLSPNRQNSKDDVAVLRGTAQPISALSPNGANSKLFSAGPTPSFINKREQAAPKPVLTESRSEHRQSPQLQSGPFDSGGEISSSLPSHLDTKSVSLSSLADIVDSPTQESPQSTPVRQKRQSMMPGRLVKERSEPMRPSLGPSRLQSGHSHTSSLERDVPKIDRGKISAPNGGVVIPQGFMFGNKDTSKEPADRERKVKSRLWGFNKTAAPAVVTRPVFGIPLKESVEIASVAGLPAVVFRCINYLEAKGAQHEEGIFRMSGSSAVIKGLRDRFNAGEFPSLIVRSYARLIPTNLRRRLRSSCSRRAMGLACDYRTFEDVPARGAFHPDP